MDEYNSSSKGGFLFGLVVVAVIGLVLALITSIRFVGTGEVGVVTQFGKVTGTELSEGIHFVKPFGIQRVRKYDVKVQKEDTKATAASKDLQDVNATVVLNYTLSQDEVSDIHQKIGPNFREKIIDPAVNEVFKSSSAKFTASEMITDRASIKKDAFEALKARLSGYFINVEDLSITNFSFSKSFTKAIEDKQVAEQNAQRAKFNLDAAKTDAKAQEAQKSTLSSLLLKKQAIEKWDGKMPQYVGGNSIFNIPLK